MVASIGKVTWHSRPQAVIDNRQKAVLLKSEKAK